jgi:hypothetical protein
MLDSLVRVSRRVVGNHFANILDVVVPYGQLNGQRRGPQSRSEH